MKLGMVIDLDRCVGCRTCMVVCKSHNAQPPGTWWNRVFTPGSREHQVPTLQKGQPQMYFLPVACQMCDNPPCQKVCPVGATYTDDWGRVQVDLERCIGCRYCLAACPYQVRQFNWENPKKAKRKAGYMEGYEYGYPFPHRDKNGRLVYTPNRPKGVVEKCTFCVQYTDNGEKPICVQACPARARFFGDLEDSSSEVNQVLRQRQAFRLKEELGTRPKVFYLPPTTPRK
ncbi:prokaryotic molybdopterin-containing oxidoreductase family, iron-sulfur binding subunit [Thermanaeromonas toyohensis ToBE]|uniref:Prokaryotic molybdopterin-containing oxidoreductase family, iron-sulfur binding subunit n=1 Tax=Thermanaeromonas toyohensis ToBE TaxID=698762 RepID=A0A1W1VY77_9FIRM|nr:4Fe-4S dicluster domain-containing protein [Thermanaeromonas toyohensis]SMB98051.1 prokaryotic molybdopterin-containing oxidoreductase family, iron-sulfur binding subunit [Thermanaeromonas toyohensis ToBE]